MYITWEDESFELSTNEASHLFSATFKRDQPFRDKFFCLSSNSLPNDNQMQQLLHACTPVLQVTTGVIAQPLLLKLMTTTIS
jgi:hypothetical protein